jgi:hypothetical protein
MYSLIPNPMLCNPVSGGFGDTAPFITSTPPYPIIQVLGSVAISNLLIFYMFL